jgi:hypothetical protein
MTYRHIPPSRWSQLQAYHSMGDIDAIRKADVIGMTITRASRTKGLLEDVGCSIVLVEEAAEVGPRCASTRIVTRCLQPSTA